MSHYPSLVATGLICVGTFACSSKTPAPSANLPTFYDLASAPSAIQTAAQAVVRIRSARSYGTGSFISGTGLLLTNNHVLGMTVCPVEGCWVSLNFGLQWGAAPTQAQTVFAVPIAVDAGYDIAILQVYQSDGATPLSTSNYLAIHSMAPSVMIGQHVTLVGHPEACLKKWTDGVVIDAVGDWVYTSAYILPGDSGSPILDDSGALVGIIHRAPTGEDLFAPAGDDVYSVGTASSYILAAQSAPSLAGMVSVDAATTSDAFATNEQIYQNGKATSINLGTSTSDPLSVLGPLCDTGLARSDFVSLEDLEAALEPCYSAQYWIDCRTDASPPPWAVVCPATTDVATWQSRYLEMNQKFVAFDGMREYNDVSFAIADLQSSRASGIIAGTEALETALDAPTPVLDYTLANYLIAFQLYTYEGTGLSDYVRNYRQVSDYQLQGTSIVECASWLWGNSQWSPADFRSFLGQIGGDPNIDVGARLFADYYQYLAQDD
jgi:V8-like Glu-specific endopeptidase